MTKIFGLAGLRPGNGYEKKVTCPPYDVIKSGTPLESLLSANAVSLYHVVLGDQPTAALQFLQAEGALVTDEEPCFYVYEQVYGEQRRVGVLTAVAVTPYEEKAVIRHEKTFETKVQGRIALMEQTGYVTEPVWLLSRAKIGSLLSQVIAEQSPLYDFTSDFAGASELHGIHNRIYRIKEADAWGQELKALIGEQPLYIADGHHRYHSALRMGLDRCIAYVCEADEARILAYNRVIRGQVPFKTIMDQLPLRSEKEFRTPEQHCFSIYTKEGAFSYRVDQVVEKIPEDPVGRLDCHLLEQTLYPLLQLEHSMINDLGHFDYFSETELAEMQRLVDQGVYDIAVALHPVSVDELMAVAEAGLIDSEIVMPEKSTFFAPKILSGLVLIPTTKLIPTV